ncbi:hypothetical protein F5887DRAFT_882710 [Amanita rubescens]|nr:hypothetical protein F5887DRAFT_882710 [Amanita rubescens]
MLVLSTLHQLLSQVLFRPHLHTAVLLTPSGELVSFACSFERPKDEIRVLVGLSGEIWRETRHHGFGMVDSEVQIQCISMAQTYKFQKQLGRIVVVPVGESLDDHASLERNQTNDPQPVLLVALNATDSMDWGDLHTRVGHDIFYSVTDDELLLQSMTLADLLAKPLGKYREVLAEPRIATLTSGQTANSMAVLR